MRCRTVLAVVLLAIAAIFAVASFIEESEATDSTLVQWNCYGYNITISDINQDPTYTYIAWSWAETPEGLDTADRVEGSELRLTEVQLLALGYQPYDVRTIFVKEDAVVAGVAKTTTFAVVINPLPSSCYVLFMYDESTGYKYGQVTKNTSVQLGRTPVVDIPGADPHRDGYEFGGWYVDSACTVPFDASTTFTFSYAGEEKRVYPKWIPSSSPGPSPVTEVHGVMIRPVAGLDIGCDGMVADHGDGFSFTVKVTDGFRFDLTNLKAQTSDGRMLERTHLEGDAYRFTLGAVTEDTTVFLFGQIQYFRLSTSLNDVRTVGFDEWVVQGGSIELPLESTIGGTVRAVVYMSYVDITGTSFFDGKVRIDNVSGDVLVVAYSEAPVPLESSDSESDIPWWAIAAVLAALVVAIAIVIRRRGRDRRRDR